MIAGAVTFLVLFVEQTGVVPRLLNQVLRLLALTLAAIINLHGAHPFTPQGLLFDGAAILVAVSFGTWFRTGTARILAQLLLFGALLGTTVVLVNRFRIVSYAAPIVFGLLLVSVGEGVATVVRMRVKRRIVTEKQEAEFGVVRHLAHNLKPGLQIVRSPLAALSGFLKERGLDREPLSRRMDGSVETVGDALKNAITCLSQLNDVIDNTRKLVAHEISREDFAEHDVKQVLEEDVFPMHREWRLSVEGGCCRVTLHKESFVEAMHNLLRNAQVHGFPDGPAGAEISFRLHESRKNLVMDYLNNGRPFPENLDPADFLTFGRKGADSPGEGLGGAWIAKMLDAHGGTFEIIRDDHPVHFRIVIPKERIS